MIIRKPLSFSLFFSVSVFMLFVFVSVNLASADSWWGKGYRDNEWVLSHGGTIIKFEIDNIVGEKNEYKAVMFDDDGDYVEKEFSVKGYFDDAKDGEYKIKAYRVEGGIIDKTTHKGGKEFASIKVTAHPGETIKIKFDYKKKKAKMTTDYVKPVPKPVVVKPAPVVPPAPEPAIEVQEEEVVAEVPVLQTEEIALIEVAQADYHQETNVTEEKSDNFFENIWKAVISFLGFK